MLILVAAAFAGCLGGNPTPPSTRETSTPPASTSTAPVTTTPLPSTQWPAASGASFEALAGALAGDSAGNTGAAAYDFDGDGKIDLYVTGTNADHLYRNNGDGTFTDVTAAAGVACARCGSVGAAWGDYDNDGKADLLVENQGAPVRLFHNNGDGTFTDVTSATGLAATDARDGAAWFDAGNDAKLDLLTLDGTSAPKVWVNDGAGHFTAGGSGLDAARGATAAALFFLEDDANLDLAAAAPDGLHVFRYVNATHGTFTDNTTRAHIPAGLAPKTIAPGDVDNDQSVDLLLAGPSGLTLLRNTRVESFTDLTARSGLANAGAMKAATFVDVDNDGWIDILAVTAAGGIVYYHSLGKVAGQLKFEKKDPGALGLATGVAGLALADMDRDGRVDVYLAGPAGASGLYLDRVAGQNFFVVQLKGNESVSQGIGSKVTLSTGSFLAYRQAGGFASPALGADPEVSFGIGSTLASSYTLAIDWPSGVQQFQSVNATRVIDKTLAAKESAVSAPWGNC